MSYYSDVAVRIEVSEGYDVNKVIEDFKENFNNEYEVFDLERCLEISSDNQVVTFWVYGIKWHDWFDEVKALFKWFAKQEEQIELCLGDIKGIQFVRIGERLDDNEDIVYGNLNEYIHISRSFEWE